MSNNTYCMKNFPKNETLKYFLNNNSEIFIKLKLVLFISFNDSAHLTGMLSWNYGSTLPHSLYDN